MGQRHLASLGRLPDPRLERAELAGCVLLRVRRLVNVRPGGLNPARSADRVLFVYGIGERCFPALREPFS
jgi:hypothetical protein